MSLARSDGRGVPPRAGRSTGSLGSRAAPLAVAAVALAGASVAVVPQHTASIGRLLVATVVACAGLVVLADLLRADVEAGAVRTSSPLDRPPTPPLRPMEAPGLAAARRTLHHAASGSPQPTRQQLVAAARRVLDELDP
jgi:hypothetical protein